MRRPEGESPLLFFADTETSTDLFAAVPTGVGDPFLFLDDGDRRVAMIGVLDAGNVRAAVPGVEIVDPMTLGYRELVADGAEHHHAHREVARRALADLGVREARVNWDFPLALADVLRADGVSLTVDERAFEDRRRVKSAVQLEGHRRAARAAVAAMDAIATLLRRAPAGLTAEQARAAGKAAADALGCDLPDDVVVGPNAQGATGHDPGSGPILPGDTVIVDLWPRDRASRCWADMTRTFIAGGAPPSDEIAEYHRLALAALDAVKALVRPGVDGRELYAASAQVFEDAGHPTQRTAPAGRPLQDGYFHALGHGVGLDLHEAPSMGLDGHVLVAGDVIAIEPGCYRSGVAGVRLEDLLVVTGDGYEDVTPYPYDL